MSKLQTALGVALGAFLSLTVVSTALIISDATNFERPTRGFFGTTTSTTSTTTTTTSTTTTTTLPPETTTTTSTTTTAPPTTTTTTTTAVPTTTTTTVPETTTTTTTIPEEMPKTGVDDTAWMLFLATISMTVGVVFLAVRKPE